MFEFEEDRRRSGVFLHPFQPLLLQDYVCDAISEEEMNRQQKGGLGLGLEKNAKNPFTLLFRSIFASQFLFAFHSLVFDSNPLSLSLSE